MINLAGQITRIVFQITDLLFALFSFFAAYYIIHFQNETLLLSQFLSTRLELRNFIIFLFFLFLWRRTFDLSGLYKPSRFSKRRLELINVIKASTFGSIVLYFIAVLLNITLITLPYLATFWFISTSMIILSRIIFRFVIQKLRLSGQDQHQMLIVGTNQRAIRFAKKVQSRPDLGYNIIGFVEKSDWIASKEFNQLGYQAVVDFEGFPEFIRENVVDEVVICLPMKSLYQVCADIVMLSQEQGIIVRVMSDFFHSQSGKSKADYLEGDALVSIYTGAMNGWQVVVKRVLDFILSFVMLLCLLPLLLIASLLIKVTSPGPILFIQDRVGLNKRIFRLFKFRTMVPDAEKKITELEKFNEVSGPVFKMKNDPRITWIGKYLRRSSIDELPQLLNVLKGDMSLVGPRPLPIRDCEGFDKDWQRRRFSVRPGMTCLWQIKGRSSISFEKWMELDMDYIDKWSLMLDLKILIMTIPAVLKGSGAS